MDEEKDKSLEARRRALLKVAREALNTCQATYLAYESQYYELDKIIESIESMLGVRS